VPFDGENWVGPPEPQPGGRAPAPGALALVQAFLNSHFDLVVEHGRDLLATPAGLHEWLSDRRLLEPGNGPFSDADASRAVTVREGLRALARLNGDPDRQLDAVRVRALNAAAHGAPVELRFNGRAGAPRFVPGDGEPLDRALGIVLAIAATAMIDGSWPRMKACPGEDCGWVFYDGSRNQSGRWCSMAVCGGRAKARGHYRRRRAGLLR
jgi:predicted RNA-binding Zn ribbon-like protein